MKMVSRDHEDGRATGNRPAVPRVVAEAYLNGVSQGPTPEDARKDGHIRGRSRRFMEHPGYPSCLKNNAPRGGRVRFRE